MFNALISGQKGNISSQGNTWNSKLRVLGSQYGEEKKTRGLNNTNKRKQRAGSVQAGKLTTERVTKVRE